MPSTFSVSCFCNLSSPDAFFLDPLNLNITRHAGLEHGGNQCVKSSFLAQL
jgi:hypothetical protein